MKNANNVLFELQYSTPRVYLAFVRMQMVGLPALHLELLEMLKPFFSSHLHNRIFVSRLGCNATLLRPIAIHKTRQTLLITAEKKTDGTR